MEEKLIKGIQVLTTKIKKENDLEENSLIRDEVFNILQKLPDCNVLYYPLSEEANEDGCDGCHIVRTIRGKARHLVYINTANTRERQAFSVAHELGHIWKVDEQLMEIVFCRFQDIPEQKKDQGSGKENHKILQQAVR